jgi:hypothetical protein
MPAMANLSNYKKKQQLCCHQDQQTLTEKPHKLLKSIPQKGNGPSQPTRLNYNNSIRTTHSIDFSNLGNHQLPQKSIITQKLNNLRHTINIKDSKL